MGIFTWISNIVTTVYNYIIDYFYPNNIVVNRQAEPAPIAVVEERPIQEPITAATIEAAPDNDTLQYTITDANENEIYSLLAQNVDIENKKIQLNYQKNPVTNEHGSLIRPDPLVNINTGLSRLMLNTAGIKHLNLNGAGIDTAGLVTLADILSRDNISLESLNLANNNRHKSKRKDPGLRALFEALGNNRTLKSINLRRTNIDNDIVESIANCLEKNSSLLTMDLSYNHILARGLRHILGAIQRNSDSSIKYFSLEDNDIYSYNNGVNPDYDDAIHRSSLSPFNIGDNNTVYRFINEISATIQRINSNRNSDIDSFRTDRLAFLTFKKCTTINKENKCSVLSYDIVGKVGEMLFSSSLRRTKDDQKFLIKAKDPIVLHCPALPTWTGPKIQ